MSSPLTEEQRAAVDLFDRPVALIAAAGSGKTTVLVERYLRCLERGLRPDQILCVTFTNEAAKQLRARISARIESGSPSLAGLSAEIAISPDIGTLHSFCLRLLSRYGALLDFAPIEKILDSFDTAEVFQSQYSSWINGCDPETLNVLMGERRPSEFETLAHAVFEKRNRFLAAFRHLDPRDIFYPCAAELARWLQNIQESLWQKGWYSFDDLEHLALELLASSVECRHELADTYRAILVDEFQDTSPEQWTLLQTLAADQTEKLFVVGDPKQSIYAFRGADLSVYLRAIDELCPLGSAPPLALTITYRADPTLIEWINRFSQFLFAESSLPFSEMRAGRESAVHSAPRIEIAYFDSAEGESAAAVASVRAAIAAGIAAREIAVLFRFSDRIPLYAEALRAEGIAIQCNRTQSLFDRYEVQDLCSYLRAIADPGDDTRLAAFFRSAYLDFSEVDLESLRAERRGLYSAWSGHPTLRSRGTWFREFVEGGEVALWPALGTLFTNCETALESISFTVHLLAPLTARSTTVFEAIAKLDAWEKEGILFSSKTQDQPDAVSLLTVHGAKGLEFGHVVLVDSLRRPPNQAPSIVFGLGTRMAAKSEDEVSEYRDIVERTRTKQQAEAKRLLYVALTRAKESFCLVLPSQKMKIGGDTWADWLVRFLDEKLQG